MDKYWIRPPEPGKQDLVVIHVCDEARQVNRDFCCKRDILVKHMKYFEKFLAENANGYEDIDISVHCDVEIFEWLMVYIHDPGNAVTIEKSIVVSILISSEFLQMESLVDICIERISQSLGDIIKLPIDLSCISEKLVNRIAAIVSPKILAQTKDRKDKILNKLYKRRVELDFSRKSTGRNGIKTIATSLTCCKYCGSVYLDQYQSELICFEAPISIDFRGGLTRRHYSTSGWSLTSYLKALHVGGMGWDAIYWHVWAACIVLQAKNHYFSALDIDKYSVEIDGIYVNSSAFYQKKGEDLTPGSDKEADHKIDSSASNLSIDFSVSTPPNNECYRILVSAFEELDPSYNHITSTLCPTRNPAILTQEILELLTSQMKFIAALGHRKLIESTTRSILAALPRDNVSDANWGVDYEALLYSGSGGDEERRGRSLSPLNRGAASSNNRGANPATAGAGKGRNGDEGADTMDSRRSRSSGVSVNRRGMSKVSQSVPPRERKNKDGSASEGVEGSQLDGGGADGGATNSSAAAPVATASAAEEVSPLNDSLLRSLPSDVFKAVLADRGGLSSYGIVLANNPLQLLPPEMYDVMGTVQESGLSESKKLEWNLDVIREYDEKRFDRCESFLVSQRNGSSEVQLEYVNKPLKQLYKTKKMNSQDENRSQRMSGDYYKDKGRFPSRPSL